MVASIYSDSTKIAGVAANDAKVVCVFVHGRSQSPDEMLEHVIRHLSAPSTRYILPKSADEGWYDGRAIDPISAETESQLFIALSVLDEVISKARAECPEAVFVLAGFSQGACLSAEHVMRGGQKPDALCLFTGCRVGVAADKLPVSALGGLPVYASCGDADPWIPVAAFQEMAQNLIDSGARLRTEAFPGREHCVVAAECDALNSFLINLESDIPAFGEKEAA